MADKWTRMYARSRYDARKAAGVCVLCGKADDRTRAGHTNCLACAEKKRQDSLARYYRKKSIKEAAKK